ncbi:cation:dicarboxylase symporter family transporter, partial [Sphingomonas sp. 66-10]|uniref:cation:dicarboxylate symporter family transporter n=1 Tax=Sphingomonas sp. 66-10 TaxID=1895848 RepID=UPI00257C7615
MVGGIVLLTAFVLLVAVLARTPLRAFARAVLPAQSVAFSTQSSLASLPAMLDAARALGLPARHAGTCFRSRSPSACRSTCCPCSWRSTRSP